MYFISNFSDKIVLVLTTLFPILALTMRNAGSTILALLFFISLFSIKNGIKKIDNKEWKILVGLLIVFAVASISLVQTSELGEGLRRLERYARIIMVIPIYIMLRKKQIDFRNYISIAFVATAYLMLGQSVYQVYFKDLSAAQGAYHQILFGEYAVLIAGLIGVLLLLDDKKQLFGKLRVFAYFGMVSALFVAVLSDSKGAWLAIPFILALIGFLFRKKIRFSQIVVAIVVLGLAAIAIGSTDRVDDRFSAMRKDYQAYLKNPRTEGTLSTRLKMWRDSLIIFEKSPLLGTGIGDYQQDIQIMIKKGISYQTDSIYSHPHSIYFDALACTGLLGLLALIIGNFLIPFMLFFNQWTNLEDKKNDLIALAGMITIVSYATFGLTETWFAQNSPTDVYFLFLVLFMYLLINQKSKAVDS